jgi:16S rRNA (cytosine967-C5)-methyltransferase
MNKRETTGSGGTRTRSIALSILKEVNQDGKYANISLKEHLRGEALSDRDAAFVTQLVYGTLEKQITIDYYLKRFATFKRVNPWIMNILRLGAYQLLYLDRVPDSAACNEAVKLCKMHGLFALQGFVNGILRNLARNKDKLTLPDDSLSLSENLSLQYSYPKWLVDKWITDYGPETAEAILKPADIDDAVSIRVNTMKISPENLKDRLEQSGIVVRDGYHMREALRISNAGDIEENPYYQEGLFTVQGESSMLDAHIVDPQPGETILDACSSPGGKAIHMAELMKGQGRIAAWDVHDHRVALIERNRTRMDAGIVEPSVRDASEHDAELIDRFDRVLIDAPCSGLGIIIKKPDIKLNIKPNGLSELSSLQEKIITTCSSYVKPGGILVYSTCTINPLENEDIVQRLLTKRQDFVLEDPSAFMPVTLKSAVKDGMIQLIPSRHRTDGFFIARLRRKT